MSKSDISGAMLVLTLFGFVVLLLGTIFGVIVLDNDLGAKATSKETVTTIVEDEETTLYSITCKAGGGGLSKSYETSKAVFDKIEVGKWYEFELSGFPRNYIEDFSE